MRDSKSDLKMKHTKFLVGMTLIVLFATVSADGQGGRGGAPPPPPPTGRAGAAFDMTGYWVSVVSEDWRYRMVTPPKGDYQGVPLNAEARKIADAWDPARDEAAGEQCKSYGAANIMRVPERLHITWQDDQTLKLETDAGTQTRTFYFSNPPASPASWQGVSKAVWDAGPDFGVDPTKFDPRFGSLSKITGGSLKVVTTKLRPGHIRKNGIPYSEKAVVTEYYDRVNTRNGDAYLVVTTAVDDPMYLRQPYETSASFRKQADASGWNPSPCMAR